MTDLSATLDAKVDQLTADELLGGPRTITVTRVSGNDDPAQPISISFDGDNGKPFKPCLTMRRLLVGVWGPDGSKYVGRSMTVYRDGDVQFGGIKTGGVRISHVDGITEKKTLNLTKTRGKKAPIVVQPLKPAPKSEPDFDFPAFESAISLALETPQTHAELSTWWESLKPERIKARAADQIRAGQSATLVNEKLAELSNND